jgi:hypothetical protein
MRLIALRYTEIAKNIRKVCGYMHRYFIPETGKTDLFVMALVKWREVRPAIYCCCCRCC